MLICVFLAALAGCRCDKNSPAKTSGPAITVTFVGDTGLGDQAVEFVAEHGLRKSFERMREALGSTDFLIGNGETPIADAKLPLRSGKAWQPWPDVHKGWRPKQDPAAAKVYAKEGFYAFSLANNHSLDFGVDGLKQTMDYLARANIKIFGAGMSAFEARQPLILEKNGIKVGILGCFEQQKKYKKMADWFAAPDRPGVAALREKDLREDIEKLKKQVDVVVLFPHWGVNYRKVTKNQQKQAAWIAKAGVDLVVGHGAHMAQRVELLQGVPVLYGIGNFIWHSKGLYKRNKVDQYAYTLVTRVVIGKEGVRRITLIPFHSDNRKVYFIPQPVKLKRGTRLFTEILAPIKGRWRMEEQTAVIDLR